MLSPARQVFGGTVSAGARRGSGVGLRGAFVANRTVFICFGGVATRTPSGVKGRMVRPRCVLATLLPSGGTGFSAGSAGASGVKGCKIATIKTCGRLFGRGGTARSLLRAIAPFSRFAPPIVGRGFRGGTGGGRFILSPTRALLGNGLLRFAQGGFRRSGALSSSVPRVC